MEVVPRSVRYVHRIHAQESPEMAVIHVQLVTSVPWIPVAQRRRVHMEHGVLQGMKAVASPAQLVHIAPVSVFVSEYLLSGLH